LLLTREAYSGGAVVDVMVRRAAPRDDPREAYMSVIALEALVLQRLKRIASMRI
jgi:hypothetical protein